MTIKERFKAPTPKFWKKVRNIGFTVGALGGGLLTLPISLPASLITIAGYMVATGTLTGILSQTTIKDGPVNN
jgi:ABC-type xylose transport system permease subunit